jgi:aspartate kinase
VAGIAHRRQESIYTADDTGAGTVVAALAERGIAVGALAPMDTGVRFTAPGAEPAEVSAALDAVGAVAKVDEELGSVSVVSLGIARKPDVVVRALAALEAAGIVPRLITTTPGRITAAVPSSQVDDAVRLLHRTFIPAAVATIVSDLRPPADAA